MRKIVIALSRLTRWGLKTILALSFEEACLWLEEAAEFERSLQG